MFKTFVSLLSGHASISILHGIQTNLGTNPASYPMGTGIRDVKMITNLHMLSTIRMFTFISHAAAWSDN
jgi:hypothetical protein